MESNGTALKNGKRGNANNKLMKAKRCLDEAMALLGEHPKLRDRVREVRDDLLAAFVELERSTV